MLIHRTFFLILLFFPLMLPACGGGNPVDPSDSFALLTLVSTDILSSPPIYAYDTQVTVSPKTGELFCCWARKEGATREIFWRHGSAGSFSDEEAITPLDGVRSFIPALRAGSDGKVHFAFMDERTGFREMFAKMYNRDEPALR